MLKLFRDYGICVIKNIQMRVLWIRRMWKKLPRNAISTKAHYVNLQKNISHIQVLVIYFFSNRTHKTETGNAMGDY